jgi:hypothetical protein
MAQSDVNSPYTLFGVGKENTSTFGGSNGFANTGIAYSNGLLINKINPASLTAIEPTSFLYEVGLNSTLSLKADNNSTQTNYNFNFTHIGIAFSVSNHWKMSFGLVPKTKTSYDIDFIEPVEGDTGLYYTSITGSGGVNELFWGHGFKIGKNLSLGVELNAYFGAINQEKYIDYETTQVYLKESSSYTGVGLKGGFQYKLNNLLGTNTTFGGIVYVPSTLNGSQDIEGTKTSGISNSDIIIAEEDLEIDNFDIPLKIGFGITSQINKLTINLDYQKSYWGDSYISNTNFSYNNQNIYGLGFEYKRQTNTLRYYKKIIYRMGMNYDTGYLDFSGTKINTYGFSAGIGLPVSNRGSSLNFSYAYGKEGTLSNNLIMDNFHKISLNISLHANWFQKQKIF